MWKGMIKDEVTVFKVLNRLWTKEKGGWKCNGPKIIK